MDGAIPPTVRTASSGPFRVETRPRARHLAATTGIRRPADSQPSGASLFCDDGVLSTFNDGGRTFGDNGKGMLLVSKASTLDGEGQLDQGRGKRLRPIEGGQAPGKRHQQVALSDGGVIAWAIPVGHPSPTPHSLRMRPTSVGGSIVGELNPSGRVGAVR